MKHIMVATVLLLNPDLMTSGWHGAMKNAPLLRLSPAAEGGYSFAHEKTRTTADILAISKDAKQWTDRPPSVQRRQEMTEPLQRLSRAIIIKGADIPADA